MMEPDKEPNDVTSLATLSSIDVICTLLGSALFASFATIYTSVTA